MVSGGMTCVKYLLFVFNLLFVISGIIIITFGAIVLDQYGGFSTFLKDQYSTGPLILIVVGVIIFVVAFFGCCGAVKENHCMVVTFAVLLLGIFCLELAAGICGYVLKNEVNEVLEEQLNRTMGNYTSNEAIQKSWDVTQTDLKCCGVTGPEDWKVINSTFIPHSCCANIAITDTCLQKDAYKQGCLMDLQQMFEKLAVTMGGVGIGIAFVQLVGVIFACCLAKSIRKEYETV